MSTNRNSSPKPRKALWFFVCIGILGFGVGSFMVLQALKPAPEQRDPTLFTPNVDTITLSYRLSPLLVEGNGIVSPRAEIGLSAQVAGEVISVNPNLVTGGSFVKGELIIQIDSRSFSANLAEAEANKNASLSNLTFITKQIERLESLMEQGYSPEESLDEAIMRRDQALANIARQDAIIEIRQLDLERTSIKAPFAGRVLSKNVAVGDVISIGRELARLYASDEVEVVVSLTASDASYIPGIWSQTKDQRKALISVKHGESFYEWDAYLDRVEADIDQITRTVDVVVRVPEPFRPGSLVGEKKSSLPLDPPPLLVGMYGTVSIEGLSVPNHFVLPINALRDDNTIWITNSDGLLSIEKVELIREEGNLAVLLAPQLSPGTPIIVSDIALVTNGMRVRAQLLESEQQ